MDYPNLTTDALLQECTNGGKPEAWAEFVRRFQPLIAGVITRTAGRYGEAGPALVDDLVQETYLRLCAEEWRRLREFQSRGDGSIYGFMKTVARAVTLDYFKAQYTRKRGAARHSRADLDTVLKIAADHGIVEEQILMREIEERLIQIAASATERCIFLLYYRHGFTARAIAEIPIIRLSQKGVESCLQRLTRQLQQELVVPPAEAIGKENSRDSRSLGKFGGSKRQAS